MSARRRRLASGSESDPRSSFVLTIPEPTGQPPSNNSTNNYTQPKYNNNNNNNNSNISVKSQSSNSTNKPVSEMTCRDRTSEYMSAVKSMQGRQMNGAILGDTRKERDLAKCSEFMKFAKLIGRDLNNTYTKLEKLALLAKKKSLFDDRPVEIQELTYIIKQDIGNLNKQIAQLQEFVRSKRQQNGRHMQSHSNTVVVSLQSRLASMSNEFKKVLEVRTENLKQQKNRRDQFSQGPVAASLPPSAMIGYHQGSVLLADEQASKGDFTINMEDNQPRYQSQMQLIDEDSYVQNRADTMQNIESTIVELGEIFQQLAFMVKEQEEMIQRIDANVEDTQLNVEAAHGEILKYFQSVTSNRWLMIKVFAVLIVFFIVFIVFMA